MTDYVGHLGDPHMIPGGPSSRENIVHMLGKKVRVTLQHKPLVVTEGTLLGYGDGGDIELEGSDGLVYHCWPRLRIELCE